MLFNHAILRKPGAEIIDGLSQHATCDKPNYQNALQQHQVYAQTLEKMGVKPIICAAESAFPDGCFTEDTHLILPEIVIRLNPGAPSRAAEPDSLSNALPKDRPLQCIPKDCNIDGGDILVSERVVYVGLSERTQMTAIHALQEILKPYNYTVLAVAVPEGLHLKSGMTCIPSDIFIIQASFKVVIEQINKALDTNKKYFVVPATENDAANVLPINNAIMMPVNCPQTKAFIAEHYALDKIYEVDTSEFRKVDGALTCLSIPY